MKRHHIVGIIAGICGIGLAIHNLLSENIVEAFTSFIILSILAVATFLKDKLPPRWSQPIFPSWLRVVLVCISLLMLLFFNYFR